MSEVAGAINAYKCPVCDGLTVTRNLVDGTTPFLITCRATPGCVGVAQSQFYKVDQSLQPTAEWFKPKQAELSEHIRQAMEMFKIPPAQRRHVERDVREHVRLGGLLLRDIRSKKLMEV